MNIGFAALIAAVVLILVGAVAAGYYNDHFKAAARVAGTEISIDEWTDRARLTLYRLDRAEARVREAVASGELTAEAAQNRLDSISSAETEVQSSSIESLIDLVYQGRLAEAEGITATDTEVEEAIQKEISTSERRTVLAIFVAPEVSVPGASPTAEQRQAALDRADEALAALNAGTDFAQVARQYSTDASRERGGEYGTITNTNPTDPAWVNALFEVPLDGTTDIVEGSDGTFRIGRVTEINPGARDEQYLTDLQETLSLDTYRRNVRREVVATKLRDKVVADATQGDVEQVRLAEIVLRLKGGEESANEIEARSRHILYSPGDDPSSAQDLPADDPAWLKVRADAEAAAIRVRSAGDPAAREATLGEIAMAESDDLGSGELGGDLGWVPRSLLVEEYANAIFEGEHERGDVLGPVRSQFGYHLIMFIERGGTIQDRLTEVLGLVQAPDADFAAIAREHSEGDTAEQGGELGWKVRDQLTTEVADAVFATEPGRTTPQITQDDGYFIYKVLEKAARPLNTEQRLAVETNAFEAWYDPKKQAAEESGEIARDPVIFPPQPELDEGVEPSF